MIFYNKRRYSIEEIWKPVKSYEGIYEISNFGNLRNLDRYILRTDGITFFRRGKDRPKLLNTDGYVQAKLCKDGKYVTIRIHRLVAEHFIPNPNNLPEVNHKDCDRTNNRVDNLEWCTHLDNIHYTMEKGNHVCQTDICGKNNPNYGNHILSEIYRNNPTLAKEKLARPQAQNGRARKVQMFDNNGRLIECFNWIGGCANYLIQNNFTKIKSINTLRHKIKKCSDTHKPYCGFYYKLV